MPPRSQPAPSRPTAITNRHQATPIELITTSDALGPVLAACEHVDVIAIDTEFVRERTFYPQPALVQLNDGAHTSLIDPTASLDLSEFASLLGNAAVTKVMHSASEDLQVFDVLCAAGPTPLFDTQIAAAFAGHGPSISYHALVHAVCGVDLDKSQTRSDWMQRPLSVKQLHYAAEDVAYLLEIHATLCARLHERGFLHWCAEETANALTDADIYPDPADAYQRVKGAGRLSAPAQHRLRELSTWREREARARDVPRNRIAKDGELLNLAATPCRDLDELKSRLRLHPAALRRFGAALLEKAQAAFVQYPDQGRTYTPLITIRDTRKLADKIKALRAHVGARAAALDIAPTLLGTNRDIEAAVVAAFDGGPEPRLTRGWRAAALNLQIEDIQHL